MATTDANARRRRIAERGSDRMALITGRAQAMPSSPSAAVAQAHHSYTASCPSLLADQLPPIVDDSPMKSEIAGNDDGGGVKPHLRKCETSVESKQLTFEPDKIQPFTAATISTDRRPLRSFSNKVPKSQLQAYLHTTLRPNKLRPAIAASQEIRRQCSFAAGILVLLSYIGFPIIGSFLFRSIILSRPLVLLLLTNITIVVAPLILEDQGDMQRFASQEQNTGSSTSDTDFTDHLGLALEWGLLSKSIIGAFIMDAGIYSVIVVCGISFLQKLGL